MAGADREHEVRIEFPLVEEVTELQHAILADARTPRRGGPVEGRQWDRIEHGREGGREGGRVRVRESGGGAGDREVQRAGEGGDSRLQVRRDEILALDLQTRLFMGDESAPSMAMARRDTLRTLVLTHMETLAAAFPRMVELVAQLDVTREPEQHSTTIRACVLEVARAPPTTRAV